VLVIHAPKDGTLGLKGGDVVQAVDGRKPVSPSHLLRILRSYDRGETFKLDVLRNRKRETISARVAELRPVYLPPDQASRTVQRQMTAEWLRLADSIRFEPNGE